MPYNWEDFCIKYNEYLVISVHSLPGFPVRKSLNKVFISRLFIYQYGFSLEEIILVDNEQLHLQNLDKMRLLMVSVKSFEEILKMRI